MARFHWRKLLCVRVEFIQLDIHQIDEVLHEVLQDICRALNDMDEAECLHNILIFVKKAVIINGTTPRAIAKHWIFGYVKFAPESLF